MNSRVTAAKIAAQLQALIDARHIVQIECQCESYEVRVFRAYSMDHSHYQGRTLAEAVNRAALDIV